MEHPSDAVRSYRDKQRTRKCQEFPSQSQPHKLTENKTKRCRESCFEAKCESGSNSIHPNLRRSVVEVTSERISGQTTARRDKGGDGFTQSCYPHMN